MNFDTSIRGNMWKWLVLLAVAIFSICVTTPLKDKIRLGLDLKGGTSFTMGVDEEALRESAMAQVENTNDTAAAKKMDVSGTIATLDADADTVADNLAQMQAIVDQQDALREAMANGQDYTVSYTLPSTGETATRTFPARMASMIAMIINSAQETVDSAGGNLLDTLAFIWPEGGTQMGMNLANEIIVNAGLNPDLVADPNDDVEAARNAGKAYWLVVFGLGRFCDLYTGNGARLLEPVSGKRYTDDQYYNRYLMVVKVPVYGYDSMTGQGNQKASVAAISIWAIP